MSGTELRLKRVALGLQQREVAQAMGRSPALVSLVERGHIRMPRGFEARYLKGVATAERSRRRAVRTLHGVLLDERRAGGALP